MLARKAAVDAANGNFVLGGERFQEKIAHALGRRVVREKAGRPAKRVEVGRTKGYWF
jgi:hypothetical protein